MAVHEEMTCVGTGRCKGRMAAVCGQGSRFLLTGGLMVCNRCGANMVGYRNQGRLYERSAPSPGCS